MELARGNEFNRPAGTGTTMSLLQAVNDLPTVNRLYRDEEVA